MKGNILTSQDARSNGLLIVIIAAIAVVMLTAASWAPISASLTGATNYNVNPSSSNDLTISYSVSSSISGTAGTNSKGQYVVLYGCSYLGNWDVQYNLVQPTAATVIQEIVEVNQTGDSCFTVEYWPPMTMIPYYYSFNIGYSDEFYTSGYTAPQFLITASGSTITSFYVTVQDDSWVIYPSNFNTTLSMTYSSSSYGGFVFVGTGGGTNSTFSAGAGTISYNTLEWTFPGTSYSTTGEGSNMGYGTISSGSQSFTY